MTEKDFSTRILETIETRHIEPKTRLHGQLRRFGVWIAVLLSIGVASLAIGTTFSITQGNNWDAYHETGKLSKPVFLFLLCYSWILLLVACVIATYVLFVRTRHGYRYRFAPLMAAIGILGLCMGMLVFFTGAGREIEDQCERIIPGYGQVLSQSNQLWIQPDEGRLAGHVEHIKAPQTFTLIDPHGQLWLVQTGQELRDTVEDLHEKETIHMTGSKVDSKTFFAKRILLYEMPNSFLVLFRNSH